MKFNNLDKFINYRITFNIRIIAVPSEQKVVNKIDLNN